MSTLSILTDAGIQAEPFDGSLKLKGLSKLAPEQRVEIIQYARTNKPAILAALSQTGEPGQCESCPAAGYWDGRYAGLLCFYTAYYLHKSGKPTPCSETRNNCPRNDIETR